MSKTDNTPLLLLIHRMNKNEKRHFKLYARSHSPNTGIINYLELFDLIAKQNEYDEEYILKKNIVRKEHFRMLKNYLYNLILESLRVLHNNRNEIDNQLNNLISNAFIMREKGVEKEELKYLEKAKQLAFEHERWGPALQAILMQSEKMTRDVNTATMEQIEKEAKELLKKIENFFQYKRKRRESLQLLKTLDIQKSIRSKKEVRKILIHPFIRNIRNAMTAPAVKEGVFTRLMCLTAIGDFEGTLRELHQALNFLEANYSKIDFPENHLASVLSNMAGRQMELGKFDEAFPTIQKHRSITTRSLTARDYIFIFSYVNETNYYLATGEFERGIKAIEKMEEQMSKIKFLIHYTAIYVLYFNCAEIYFGTGKYSRALHWTRKITNAPAEACAEDIRAWAHIITILIHYEIKTSDILEHLTSSAKRFLDKRARLYKVEESVLTFMRRQNDITADKKIHKEEFQKFRNELKEITKDPQEEKALMYFDLLSWVESKIQNKPISEIVKQKARLN